ncbi:hypothetical protein D9611_014421 [Ephemerocybe angulata]|uniref:RRM domain-containing protein n=1 Tax=Ephemerocybe angulata TaxID=980116 RepID=A0A8H5B7B2_9AGAR|nr:hypothetical protein D9611_014421 [Tulosesus angulatus]
MSSPIPAKRLYLKGLGKDISIDELSKFLSTYGEVLEVKFVHNYAFVEYASEADAQLVYNIYRTEPLLGKHVIIQYARPLRKAIAAAARSREMAENRSPVRERRDGLSRHPVVVSGLSPDVRWQDLKDFGRSTGCLVAFCDLDRSDPDTGFLEYFTKEDAEYAVQSLDGKPLGGNVVRVLSYHDYSTERKQRRSRPRSPCRPMYPTNKSTGTGDGSWGYAPNSSWTGYSHYEGFQGKQHQPVAAYHPSQPLGYLPTAGPNRPDHPTLPLRGSFDGSCYSDETQESRYNSKVPAFYQEGTFDPSYRYAIRGGSFLDTYRR